MFLFCHICSIYDVFLANVVLSYIFTYDLFWGQIYDVKIDWMFVENNCV